MIEKLNTMFFVKFKIHFIQKPAYFHKMMRIFCKHYGVFAKFHFSRNPHIPKSMHFNATLLYEFAYITYKL